MQADALDKWIKENVLPFEHWLLGVPATTDTEPPLEAIIEIMDLHDSEGITVIEVRYFTHFDGEVDDLPREYERLLDVFGIKEGEDEQLIQPATFAHLVAKNWLSWLTAAEHSPLPELPNI